MALSLLALLLLVIRPRQVWLAAVVAVLALFTKQTAVALPVAATLWLLLSRRWRDAAVFVGTWVVLTSGTVALLNAADRRHLRPEHRPGPPEHAEERV